MKCECVRCKQVTNVNWGCNNCGMVQPVVAPAPPADPGTVEKCGQCGTTTKNHEPVKAYGMKFCDKTCLSRFTPPADPDAPLDGLGKAIQTLKDYFQWDLCDDVAREAFHTVLATVESRDYSPFIERLVAGLTERHSWYDFEAVAKVREVAAEMQKGDAR